MVDRETAFRGFAAVAAFAMFPQAASAQMAPTGAEIVGQDIRVDSNGIVNTIHFNSDGTAMVSTPGGQQVPGRWSVENQQICLEAAGGRECWPYQMLFQTGQPVTLTSNCGATSSWTALGTNPLGPPPEQRKAGERG